MKTNVILFALVIMLTSCDLMIVEPIYHDHDRDRVTGTYEMEEYSHTYNDHTHFSIYIRKAGSYDDVIIENFYNANLNIRATVVSNKIYISHQIANGYEVEGLGTFYGDKIEFSYKVRDTYSYPTLTDHCNATAWVY